MGERVGDGWMDEQAEREGRALAWERGWVGGRIAQNWPTHALSEGRGRECCPDSLHLGPCSPAGNLARTSGPAAHRVGGSLAHRLASEQASLAVVDSERLDLAFRSSQFGWKRHWGEGARSASRMPQNTAGLRVEPAATFLDLASLWPAAG